MKDSSGKKEIVSQLSDLEMLRNIPAEKLLRFCQKRILFGHQSVGANILLGVLDVADSLGNETIRVVSLDSLKDSASGFCQFTVGVNENPVSKINDFRVTFSKNIQNNFDGAFFKFCFIDFSSKTDVPFLFSQYRSVMDSIAHMSKTTRIFHVTVPLTTIQRGMKSLVKTMLGKSSGNEANCKREAFNTLLRATYDKQGNLFDLAALESTYSNGSRESGKSKGCIFYGLIKEYSLDGGHLNDAGRFHVAAGLIAFLANNFYSGVYTK